jgi:hypothetical protein
MLQGWLLLEHPQLGPLARPQRFADGAESGAESGAWRPGPALCDAAAEGRLEDLRRMLGMLGGWGGPKNGEFAKDEDSRVSRFLMVFVYTKPYKG